MKNDILKKYENSIIHVMIIWAIFGLTLKIAANSSTWAKQKIDQVPSFFWVIYFLIGALLSLYVTIDDWPDSSSKKRIENIGLTAGIIGLAVYLFINRVL